MPVPAGAGVGAGALLPVDEEPALHFALLAKMAARNGLAKVSMGMSADYEMAVRLGATHVRVGSALLTVGVGQVEAGEAGHVVDGLDACLGHDRLI